tara:strand:+ start:3111 stop:3746 length:636 start_codon:yes stop_codon:yes gene_type:complete
MNNIKKVLVLAPHTDDGEIGCGGFINKLIEEKKEVIYCAFSIAEDSVPKGFEKNILEKEVINATSKLGIKKQNVIINKFPVRKLSYNRQEILEIMIQLKSKYNFDLILTPNTNDFHQDHETICKESIRAFKHLNILGYELLWNNFKTISNCSIEISDSNLNSKIKSLMEYKSQYFRSYVTPEYIKSLALVRGVQSGFSLAESFEVIKLRIS